MTLSHYQLVAYSTFLVNFHSHLWVILLMFQVWCDYFHFRFLQIPTQILVWIFWRLFHTFQSVIKYFLLVIAWFCLVASQRNFSTSGCLSCLMFSFLQILSRSCWNTSDWVLRLSITGLSEFSIYFEKLIWSCCRRADWDLFIEDKASVNAFCKMTISVVCCDGTFIALFSAFCSVFTLVTFMLYVLVLAFSSWKCHC